LSEPLKFPNEKKKKTERQDIKYGKSFGKTKSGSGKNYSKRVELENKVLGWLIALRILLEPACNRKIVENST
jgi:hypothetical protein